MQLGPGSPRHACEPADSGGSRRDHRVWTPLPVSHLEDRRIELDICAVSSPPQEPVSPLVELPRTLHGYKINAVSMGCVPNLLSDGREHECPTALVVYLGLARLVVRLDEHYLLPQV